MADSRNLVTEMMTAGVKQQRGKPRFGRRRVAKHDPLSKDSPIAQALDGGGGATLDETQALLLTRAMIAAANADGMLDSQERAAIEASFGDTDDGGKAILANELDHPFGVAKLAAACDSRRSFLPKSATDPRILSRSISADSEVTTFMYM